MPTKKEMLLMAEHQLIGYAHASSGYWIESLVSSMGLTKSEWNTLKSEGRVNMLSDSMKEEIEEYLRSNN